MDANAVNQVIEKIAERAGGAVDKIAETAGVAVEAAKPLAERIIREYQMANMARTIAAVILVLIAVRVHRVVIRWARDKLTSVAPEACTDQYAAAIIIAWIGVLGLSIPLLCCAAFEWLPRALAPTLYCLKELL